MKLDVDKSLPIRNWNKRLKGAKATEDSVDGDIKNSRKNKQSVISKVLMIWGFVECFSLIFVLIHMADKHQFVGFPQNFINDFCDPTTKCNTTIIRIIFYKLLTSVALVVGLRYKLTLSVIPWFLINVLGVFPYSLVVTSALYNYSDVSVKYKEYTVYQKIFS